MIPVTWHHDLRTLFGYVDQFGHLVLNSNADGVDLARCTVEPVFRELRRNPAGEITGFQLVEVSLVLKSAAGELGG